MITPLKPTNNRLIAAIFILGFVLQMTILVQSTLVYHEQTKDRLTQLLLDQLAGSIAIALAKNDSIAIGLILTEYEAIPTLAQVQVYDANHKLRANAGKNPLSSGAITERIIRWESKNVGSIALALVRLDLRQALMQLLVYFILSGLVWLGLYGLTLYQLSRRETLTRRSLSTTTQPIFEDSAPTPQPSLSEPAILKRLNAQQPSEDAHVHDFDINHNYANAAESAPPTTPESYPLIMVLQFSDPSQLLETLSPGIAKPYFGLCQLLLDRAMHELSLEAKHKLVTPVILQPLAQHGTIIGFMGRSVNSLEYAVQLAVLFNRLSEYVYQHHRKHHRFALFTQSTIVEGGHKSAISAFETASQLTRHAPKNKVLLHAKNNHTGTIRKQFILDPVNALASHADDIAAVVVGINDAGIEHHLDDIQRQILQQNNVS